MLCDLGIPARLARNCLRFGALLLFCLSFAIANAQPIYRDIHDFGETTTYPNGLSGPDGFRPWDGVAFDSLGNMYGAAVFGGQPKTGATQGMGVVWEITVNGVYKDLHDFGQQIINADGLTGPDGAGPEAGVSVDSHGNIYGTTLDGGAYAGGIVWEITSGGLYKDLHDFGGTVTNADGSSGPDGNYLDIGVTVSSTGNLYGATTMGGPNNVPEGGDGMVWEITSGGVYKDLHDFGGTVTNADGSSGPDGYSPYAGVSLDTLGNIYGTTAGGGPNTGSGIGAGILWEITTVGAYRDLHDFGGTITNADGSNGPDGAAPYASITFDTLGDMYGTTVGGGPNLASEGGDGMVWEITAGGVYKDLHDFGGTVTNADGSSGPDGAAPQGGVSFDSSGNRYGSAFKGGPNGEYAGMVWELTSGGVYKDLHDFGGTTVNANGTIGADGGWPQGNIGIDQSGNLYGTTYIGGANPGNGGGGGVVWELVRDPVGFNLTLNPGTIGGLGTTTGTITLNSPAPAGGLTLTLRSGTSGYVSMPSSVSVTAGATTSTFTITGTAQRPITINIGIFASDAVSGQERILTIEGDSIVSFKLNPSQIMWTSGTSTGTVTIASAAPPGGWNVSLTPGAIGYVNMPSSVTVPAGSTSTTFSITGNGIRYFTMNLGIIASDSASKATATLVIAGDGVKSLAFSPSSIGGGGTSTATVTLQVAAPAGGWQVFISPGASGYVTMPASITVPAGATTGTFTITGTGQRSTTVNLGIFASDGNTTEEELLTLAGDSMKSLTLSPSSVPPGAGSTGTITLNAPAPGGGWVVKLTSGVPSYVGVPASVTVPAGSTTATFSITTNSSDPATNVGIVANDGVSSLEAILTIT